MAAARPGDDGQRESDVLIAASTLAIAALFRPARARMQSVIDRLFYRSKYDAAKTLETFARSLRNEVDLETMKGELPRVVQQTMERPHVSLCLRVDAPARSTPA